VSKRWKIVIAAVLVVAAAAGAGLYWFFKDDAPAPVSLEAAAKSVTDTTATSSASTATGVDGSWTVDTDTGDFDYESATGTFAGFRVDEKLAVVGSTTAVGRTGDVSGSMTISGTSVTDATFEIDLTSITTNESRRDDKVQSALETSQYPTKTFTLTEPIELGADADSGKSISVTAVGNLTIHGVTKSVEFPLEAKLVNGTVVVVGSLDITFSDYGVETPTSPAVLSVEDHGTLELQLLFQNA
jgi:polyisoprenoid-binding protein YceI